MCVVRLPWNGPGYDLGVCSDRSQVGTRFLSVSFEDECRPYYPALTVVVGPHVPPDRRPLDFVVAQEIEAGTPGKQREGLRGGSRLRAEIDARSDCHRARMDH